MQQRRASKMRTHTDRNPDVSFTARLHVQHAAKLSSAYETRRQWLLEQSRIRPEATVREMLDEYDALACCAFCSMKLTDGGIDVGSGVRVHASCQESHDAFFCS